MNMKCKNPCIGACAPTAECRVISHTPRCSCPIGFIGNPYTECLPQQGNKVIYLFDTLIKNNIVYTLYISLYNNDFFYS
jgi:hypothetical protein